MPEAFHTFQQYVRYPETFGVSPITFILIYYETLIEDCSRRTKVPQQKKWEDTDKESWKEWDYRSFQTNQRRKPKHFGEGSDQEPVTEDGATAHEDESPADSKTAAK